MHIQEEWGVFLVSPKGVGPKHNPQHHVKHVNIDLTKNTSQPVKVVEGLTQENMKKKENWKKRNNL